MYDGNAEEETIEETVEAELVWPAVSRRLAGCTKARHQLTRDEHDWMLEHEPAVAKVRH